MVAEKYLLIINRELQRAKESIEYFDKKIDVPGSEKCIAYWEGRHDMAVRCQTFLEDVLEMESIWQRQIMPINQKELKNGKSVL